MRSPEHFEYSQEMGDSFLEGVHAKALETLEMNRVEIDDFEGFYPDNKLEADKEYVSTRKQMMETPKPDQTPEERKREQKAKKIAEVMEAVIIDPRVIRSWYGVKDEAGLNICEVNAMGTSELDDYANGVDAIWELKHSQEGYANLALAVDVTFAGDFESKFQYIKGSLEKGQLGRVEYFMPKWGDMKGEVAQIPRVVIGADAKNLTDFALLWAKLSDRRSEIEAHPLQLLILEQIMLQLPIYEQYARDLGQTELAEKIQITKNKFQRLYDQTKAKLPGYHDVIEDDKMLQHLKYYLKNFKDIPSKVATGKLRQSINQKHGVK